MSSAEVLQKQVSMLIQEGKKLVQVSRDPRSYSPSTDPSYMPH